MSPDLGSRISAPWKRSRPRQPAFARSVTILALVWVVAAAWGWVWLDRGWVPHDEGALGQSAERVLQGELPHADFDEIYTGGLTYAHAAAFRVFGVELMSLRYVLFGLFLAWIPAVWYVARRFVPPWLAGLVTLLAAALSIPNYSASVPSWHLLFLSTFAVAAVFRFLDTRRRSWLAVAGLAVGASILVKIVGLYLLAALLVWLAFVEQRASRQFPDGHETGRGYSVLLTLSATALIGMLVVLVARYPGASQVALFVIPGLAVVALLVHQEWRRARPVLSVRLRAILRLLVPLGIGVIAPLAAFAVPYIRAGSLESLYEGLFVSPQARFSEATFSPPGLETLLWVLVPWILLTASQGKGPRARTRLGLLVATLLGVVLVGTMEGTVYRSVWFSMRWAIPVLVVIGMIEIHRKDHLEANDEWTVGILSVIAFVGLVQFPFSAPVYFLYVAPLAVLAFTALVGPSRQMRPVFTMLLGFYLLFVGAQVTPGFIYAMGRAPRENAHTTPLALERGGIRVTPTDREIYEEVAWILEDRPPRDIVWAGPDAPEIYFLTHRSNPTRQIFDFLSTAGQEGDLVQALEDAGVRTIVLNRRPEFSEPVSRATRAALVDRYPRGRTVGRFEVRWKP